MPGSNETVILTPESDRHKSLIELITAMQSGQLQPPPHQRNVVWTQAKKKAWAETLINSTMDPANTHRPVGTMVTYQLYNSNVMYLNDGFQRLSATKDFLANYHRYSFQGRPLTKEESVKIVWAFEVMVQHRHYKSQSEALTAFQVLQLGTPLTPQEFAKGYLTYLEEDCNWMPTLSDLKASISNLVNKYSRNYHYSKSFNYMAERYCYALFYNWLTGRKFVTPDYASITTKHLDLGDSQTGRMIEQRLGEELKKRGLQNILDELTRFKAFLEQETGAIVEVWREYHASLNLPEEEKKELHLTSTMLRFLLHVSVWRRNNGLNDMEVYKCFLKTMFIYSQGKATVGRAIDNVKIDRVVITLGSVAKLSQIVKLIEFEPYINAISDIANNAKAAALSRRQPRRVTVTGTAETPFDAPEISLAS